MVEEKRNKNELFRHVKLQSLWVYQFSLPFENFYNHFKYFCKQRKFENITEGLHLVL